MKTNKELTQNKELPFPELFRFLWKNRKWIIPVVRTVGKPIAKWTISKLKFLIKKLKDERNSDKGTGKEVRKTS